MTGVELIAYVNEWCDNEAKKWARVAVSNYYNKKSNNIK